MLGNIVAGRPLAGAGFKHVKVSAKATVSLLCRVVHGSDNNTGVHMAGDDIQGINPSRSIIGVAA